MNDDRLRDIERRLVILERDYAVDSERHKQVIDRLDRLDKHVEEKRSDEKKTFWLLLTTIFGMVVTIITVFIKAGIPSV
jgi:hypothetical protein